MISLLEKKAKLMYQDVQSKQEHKVFTEMRKNPKGKKHLPKLAHSWTLSVVN